MKERDIRVVFSMITGLLAEIAALFSGYSRGSLERKAFPSRGHGAERSLREEKRGAVRIEQRAEEASATYCDHVRPFRRTACGG
jgi:hypothetical protein